MTSPVQTPGAPKWCSICRSTVAPGQHNDAAHKLNDTARDMAKGVTSMSKIRDRVSKQARAVGEGMIDVSVLSPLLHWEQGELPKLPGTYPDPEGGPMVEDFVPTDDAMTRHVGAKANFDYPTDDKGEAEGRIRSEVAEATRGAWNITGVRYIGPLSHGLHRWEATYQDLSKNSAKTATNWTFDGQAIENGFDVVSSEDTPFLDRTKIDELREPVYATDMGPEEPEPEVVATPSYLREEDDPEQDWLFI